MIDYFLPTFRCNGDNQWNLISIFILKTRNCFIYKKIFMLRKVEPSPMVKKSWYIKNNDKIHKKVS